MDKQRIETGESVIVACVLLFILPLLVLGVQSVALRAVVGVGYLMFLRVSIREVIKYQGRTRNE